MIKVPMLIRRGNLSDICLAAVKESRGIDLTGCNYGETDGCCRFIARPTRYYYFLAGLVRSQRITYILEAGTHCGGSIMSMARGIRKRHLKRSRLVTVDVASKNDAGFKEYPFIKRIKGDSASETTAERVAGAFDRPIDLFYIDSLHEYGHTRSNIDIYTDKLNPKYIVLDDIRLSEPMRRLWREITEKFAKEALDLSEMVGRNQAGFGIVRAR